MKGKNIVEKYFHQKDFSIAEIIVLILAVASAIVAIFIQGGGPIGLPALLVCICAFSIIHSKKIKAVSCMLYTIWHGQKDKR